MLIVQLIESGSIVIITKFDFSQLFSCVHCVVGQSVTHVLVVVTLTLLFLLGFFCLFVFWLSRVYYILFGSPCFCSFSRVVQEERSFFADLTVACLSDILEGPFLSSSLVSTFLLIFGLS